MTKISESHIEDWVLKVLQDKGYQFISPENLETGLSGSLRDRFQDVILPNLLQEALVRINPGISLQSIGQAIKDVERIASYGDLISCNQQFQKLLTEGVDVTFMDKGQERTQKVWLVDAHHPENNLWSVTHQMTIVENGQNKRPDVIIFLNGIPVVVIELKNATDEAATTEKAYQQLKTYHATIPTLFCYNLMEIISDGLEARVGTITSDISRFMSWKTADGKTIAGRNTSELGVMMDGLLNTSTLLDMILHFTVFENFSYEDQRTKTIQIGVTKKIAAYHQYYAVKKAVISATIASAEGGSKKGGVIWHTQGSGKSLSMVFFTGLLVRELNNPTIIVITDRNDLDDQLFETFANCKQLLRQVPQQIDSRHTLIK